MNAQPKGRSGSHADCQCTIGTAPAFNLLSMYLLLCFFFNYIITKAALGYLIPYSRLDA